MAREDEFTKLIFICYLSLLMPALVYIFIVVMHFTDYYDPLYSYHELVVRFSSPDTRLVQIARITILTLLVFLCFFFIGLKSARRADNVCFDSKFISLCDL